jgi:L-lactate dehydrogenase complex protein LldG
MSVESAKGADTRRQAGEKDLSPSGGAVETAPVLRAFVETRAAILARIRAANGARAGADIRAQREEDWTALPRQYRTQGKLTEAERLQLFDERLRHYNGTPFYSTDDIPADIAKILSERGKRNLLVPPGLPGDWLPEGFEFTRDDNLSKQQLNAFDGVITECTLGIALTGTVVLESSPSQGRRAATLIPDYHLCILRKNDIVELVPEAIRRLEAIKDHPLTFFSGPSATVDIEMTRVHGVHGPRTLDVLLI